MICFNDDLHILAEHKCSPLKPHGYSCFWVRRDLELQQEEEESEELAPT